VVKVCSQSAVVLTLVRGVRPEEESVRWSGEIKRDKERKRGVQKSVQDEAEV